MFLLVCENAEEKKKRQIEKTMRCFDDWLDMVLLFRTIKDAPEREFHKCESIFLRLHCRWFKPTAMKKLFYYSQLRIIQHDLLLSIQFKLNGSNRVMCGAFHFDHFAEAKFLVLHFLTSL